MYLYLALLCHVTYHIPVRRQGFEPWQVMLYLTSRPNQLWHPLSLLTCRHRNVVSRRYSYWRTNYRGCKCAEFCLHSPTSLHIVAQLCTDSLSSPFARSVVQCHSFIEDQILSQQTPERLSRYNDYTCYGLDDRGIMVGFPAGTRDIYLL